MKRLTSIALSGLITILAQSHAFGFSLEGQNAPRANQGTNWNGGPLRGWYELEFIPSRVVLQPGSNQPVTINFNHTKNSSVVKRGIQNLFYFSPSTNVTMTTPVLNGVTAQEDWNYTFTASVTNNQTGYVYFFTRMSAGAHLFGGSSLDLYYAPLQIMKPGPSNGTPDLIIKKTGPSTVYSGSTYTYSLMFSNSLAYTNTAVGVQLSDFLPAGTTYVPGSFQGSGLVTNMTVEGNQLWWDLQDLPPGANGVVTYQVAIPVGFTNGPTIQNYAQIQCAQDDANEADNISIVTSTVVNSPPAATDDMYTIYCNQTLTVGSPGILGNDSDPAGFTLQSILASNISSGTLTLFTSGAFTYTPLSNYAGTVTFYYVATNGYSGSSLAKVTINVLQLLAPPNTNFSCAALIPPPTTNLSDYIAQGGIASGPYCGQPTTVTFVGDLSNGGSGCPASPLIITRTYQLTTGCGDTTNVVQQFTVIDSSLPVITAFPADATYSCASDVPGPDDTLVGNSDNCSGIVTVSHDADVITAGSCPNRFTIARTYRVSDSCGNSTSQTQHITVSDQSAPAITAFPPDATYTCISAVPAASDSLVSATDNCGGALTVTHNQDVVTSSNCVNRLTMTRTYVVTDACGNSTSRTQNITVNGTTAPTIVAFPVDATYSCSGSVPSADDTLVNATNACGGSSGVVITHLSDVMSSSNCVNRFTISRTYIASDACGNSSSKTQTITVNGTVPPTITLFPGDATYSCAGSVPPADDTLISATNACGGASALTVTHLADVISSSNCVNRFSITRTYRVTDACGNSTSKNQTITVNGTTPPTITTFPVDATYSCAGSVPSANDSLVTATNACGGISGVTITHRTDVVTSSNCVNRFTVSRTYIATDACGNSSSKTQTITVNGTTPPLITAFPGDATYSCASSVPVANDSLIAATNACGGSAGISVAHVADLITSSNCANHFTISRTYTVTDACGNSSSKMQTITVNGTTPPTITAFPPDQTFACIDAVPSANNNVVTAIDNCGNATALTITHDADVIVSSNCVNRLTIKRTYRVTDACGNSTSRTETLTVNGTNAPVITSFPANATYSCANAVPSADNTLVQATNACGGITGLVVTHNTDVISLSNCVNHFTITRTYIATDSCGNSSSRSQTITVNGTTPPTLTAFPADATYSCASAVPGANNLLVAAIDNCGATAVTITHDADLITASNCVNRFTIQRTYRVTDACGNATSKTQKITVNGTNAPTIAAFPVDATYLCANAVPAADNSLVSATDGCGASSGLVITHNTDVISSSNCVNRFVISRTYIATDACGNSSSKTQKITVNGTNAPTIATFPADATYSCANAVPAANNSLVTATDGCGASSGLVITHNTDVISSSNCVNRFVISRTYIATDACGNFSSKTQKITVNGTTAPTITAFPVDATYACRNAVPSANNLLVSATDGCGATSGIVITHGNDVISSSNCVNRFTITRTYTATDACGNASSKSQIITVNGTTAPTITGFPNDASYSCATAVPSANDTLVMATDNCGATSTVTITHAADVVTSSNCVNRFMISRTYIATDACGNSASKTQRITVNGTTPPTIATFPGDATFACAGDVPTANNSLVTATDGCGASSGLVITHAADVISSSNCVNRFTISRTYIATDACGNSASKTQTLTINATTPPTIATFPPDATFSCATAVPTADDTLVSATDGCGASSGLVITHNDDVITSSNCVNRFVISRTYVVTDACGNSASETQTITVNGTTPPTVTAFPNDVTFECAALVPDANDSQIQAIDDCGAAAVTVTHDADVIVTNFCANHFILQRTYHVTDGCGNATSQTQTITVNDTIAPEITCPPGFTVSLFDDIPGPNFELVVATDNCSDPLRSFVGETYATNNHIVTITRVFAATDDCGNSSTCSQIITMNPYLATGTANADIYSTLENQTLNVTAPGVLANDTDPNNLALQAILVSGPSNGALTLNSDGSFQYVPNTYFAGQDSFTYEAYNGGTLTAPVTVLINVIFVNQVPSFTKGANQIVNNYDPAQSRPNWASNISAGPANESSQTLQFLVSNDNNSIFAAQPAISPNGTLTYTPAAGHYGTATVSVAIKDNGGTANGGVDTSATQTFSIIVNNPPIATINIPTNSSLFLYPSPVDIIATAIDLDGTVADVTFFSGTNAIGQGTPAGNNLFTFTWTNAPATDSVLYALATDNYGATNLSAPVNIRLGNPVNATGGPIAFSPSLFSWAQKISATNPTISLVQSVTLTFTSIQPSGTSVVNVTGTNDIGQPYITITSSIPPVSGIDNYATLLFVAPSQPQVTFTTSASLSPGPVFTVNPNTVVPITRRQLQPDGSVLINFLSQTNHVYYVQYCTDLTTWTTSPLPLRGNGTQMQWVDIGPNVTVSAPRNSPYRFYRVVCP